MGMGAEPAMPIGCRAINLPPSNRPVLALFAKYIVQVPSMPAPGSNMNIDNAVRAFSADHVAKLTELSQRQLRYWDETGFFRPRYASENRRSPFSRIYSFKDVVGLRTVSVLRKAYAIPLQTLRKVARELMQYNDAPWAEVVLYVFGKDVLFREPETGKVRGVLDKQYVNIPLRNIIEDVAEKSNRLRERTKQQIGRVERRRYIAHNAWVVAGTRIPTAAIGRFSAAGYSTGQIMREYPTLTPQDIEAALKHERKLAKAA
jgi:DNA-binding transcriptional MerR regulator